MADWYYGKDNAQHGPVSDMEIRNLISTGQINQNSIVWREGMADWLPLSQVHELQGGQAAPQAANSPYTSPQTYAGQAPYTGSIPTDGLSIASMICGIIGVLSCYFGALLGIPAVICGHMSLKKIRNSPMPIQGKGMAIAGLVTGYIGILMSLCVLAIFVFALASSSTVTPTP